MSLLSFLRAAAASGRNRSASLHVESSSRSSFWQDVERHSVSLQIPRAPPCLDNHFRKPQDSPSFIPPRKVFLTISQVWLSTSFALPTSVSSSLKAAKRFLLVMRRLFLR